MTPIRIKSYGCSERGNVRAKNEDAFLVQEEYSGWCVADGLGGHPGGEVASRLAVDHFQRELAGLTRGAASWQKADLAERFDRINQAIISHGTTHPEVVGLGTTLTGLIFETDRRGWCFHAGDSRLYTLTREGEFIQLTQDQTLALDQVRMGLLSEEEALQNPAWHILTCCLGSDQFYTSVEPLELDRYRAFLLCTDGLTNMVPDREIQTLVERNLEQPETACAELVQQALEGGGLDNITTVLVTILEEDS